MEEAMSTPEPTPDSPLPGPRQLTLTEGSLCLGTAEVVTRRLQFTTTGDADMVNLTQGVRQAVRESGLRAGLVTIFVPGATGAVTTLEFEPGVVKDFRALFDRVASPTEHYYHNDTHPDCNGHAHVRAGLLGPSLVVPFEEAEPCLGHWQEIAFVCFDNRPRQRTVILQLMGVR